MTPQLKQAADALAEAVNQVLSTPQPFHVMPYLSHCLEAYEEAAKQEAPEDWIQPARLIEAARDLYPRDTGLHSQIKGLIEHLFTVPTPPAPEVTLAEARRQTAFHISYAQRMAEDVKALFARAEEAEAKLAAYEKEVPEVTLAEVEAWILEGVGVSQSARRGLELIQEAKAAILQAKANAK